jgi:hypothetical protein
MGGPRGLFPTLNRVVFICGTLNDLRGPEAAPGFSVDLGHLPDRTVLKGWKEADKCGFRPICLTIRRIEVHLPSGNRSAKRWGGNIALLDVPLTTKVPITAARACRRTINNNGCTNDIASLTI